MRFLFILIVVFVTFVYVAQTGPIDNKDTTKDSKSAFGPAFDEIVVESHLTVRRKNNGRQAKSQNVTNENSGIIKTKREIKLPYNPQIGPKFAFAQKPFSGAASAASSQSQDFNSMGPLGHFGASASSAQNQNFAFGPNGITGSASFSGTQQYRFNGQTVDISFGNAFGGNGAKAGGAVITITGPDGVKRPFRG